MRFVNRVQELARLDHLVEAGGARLAVVWGRRRIGKTRLLLEWTARHRGLYAVADLSAAPIQRRYFAEALSARFPGFAEVEYPDWRTLLRAAAREARSSSWNGPLVLDEFPYWVESSPELPTVLQNFIDHEAREAGLVMALSGSSGHMIHGLTLDASAPLFGRASATFALGPMTPQAMAEALDLRDPVEIVKFFAVWGGVPRYWELAESYGRELDRAVDELMFDPLGPLHREPERLLAEERPPALAVRPLLDAIGQGAHRLSEIAGRLGVAATSLGRPLSRLTEMGLVVREQPFGESERGGKRSLYRIADPLFRAWFRMVAPYRAQLASGSRSSRTLLWERFRSGLFAQAWEELCRRAAAALAASPGSGSRAVDWPAAGRFWGGSGPEWDVVAVSSDGSEAMVGEVKWSEAPVSRGELAQRFSDLTAKGLPPPVSRHRGARVAWAVFVPAVEGGVPELPEGWRVFTAADVIAAIG